MLRIPFRSRLVHDHDVQGPELRTSRLFASLPKRGDLTRLLLLWQMPARWGIGEARAREEVRALAERELSLLLEAKGIAAAELVRLERAGDVHPLWYDWMLVVDVANDLESQRPLDDLFEDLLSANAHPIMLRCAEP